MSVISDTLMARLAKLPPGLLEHCQRVSQKSLDLALRYGASPDKAALAGLAHDIARAATQQELLDTAIALGIPMGDTERDAPILLHGSVGAQLLRQEIGISDEEVMEAVAWHSTGRRGMSLLEKIVFLADKMEDGKAGYYQGLGNLADALDRGLDHALLAYFDWQLAHLMETGKPIHPATVEARNEILRSLRPGP